MRQRKKGSSYITIMILMMFLMIVGGVTVAFTMFDIKMRQTESTRVENLYGAESGLNVSEAILYSASDYAILEALDAASQTLDDAAEVFKQTYVNAMFDSNYQHNGASLSHPDGHFENLIEHAFRTRTIPVMQDDAETKTLVFKNLNIQGLVNDFVLELNTFEKTEDKLTFNVTSSYQLDETAPLGEHERQVSRGFTIKIPTYSSTVGTIVPAANGKVLAVDGTVYLGANVQDKTPSTRTSTLDVNLIGDVWIQGLLNGKAPSITQVSYDNYQSGLLLEKVNLEVKGNLVTKESVSLFNDANLTVENGNIYGRNLYVGKRNIGSIATNSGVKVQDSTGVFGEVVLNNDLVINASSCGLNDLTCKHHEILINEFYGIEDKTFATDELVENNIENLVTSSSAIIVNQQGPKVTVKDDAYIGGVAFIDTEGEKYQTGESVSVKPNYLAYSMILPGYEDKVMMKYYNPLMLVEAIEGASGNSLDKSDYFMEAVKQDFELLSGSVRLPDRTQAVGVYVNKDGEFVSPTLQMDQEVAIKSEKVPVFNQEVEYMGIEEINEKLTVSSMFKEDWGAAPTIKDKQLILNSNKDIPIYLSQSEVKIAGTSYPINSSVFLVTRGDVIVKESVNLTGNFIIGGNLSAEFNYSNEDEMTLKYDEEFMKSMVARYANELSAVFKEEIKGSESTTVGTPNGGYNAKELVAPGRWTLEK